MAVGDPPEADFPARVTSFSLLLPRQGVRPGNWRDPRVHILVRALAPRTEWYWGQGIWRGRLYF